MTLIFCREYAFAISMLQNSIDKIVGDTNIKDSPGKIGKNVN